MTCNSFENQTFLLIDLLFLVLICRYFEVDDRFLYGNIIFVLGMVIGSIYVYESQIEHECNNNNTDQNKSDQDTNRNNNNNIVRRRYSF